MSLFAILYTADELSPEQAIAKLFPGQAAPPHELSARASAIKTKNFIREDCGVAARTQVYFTLDKERSDAARQALGAAVRAFVASTDGDMVLLYHDTAVVRRVGAVREYSQPADFAIPGWNEVANIRLPRDAADGS